MWKEIPNLLQAISEMAVTNIFCNGDILDISLLILGTRKLYPLLILFNILPDNINSERGKEKKR